MTVVYGRPNCVQCRYTLRELTKLGVEYTYVDIDQDAEAADAVRATGLTALPVVVTAAGTWGGFQPDKIRALAA